MLPALRSAPDFHKKERRGLSFPMLPDSQHQLVKTINSRLTDTPENIIWVGQTLTEMFGRHLPKTTWNDWGIKLSYQEASDIRSLSQCPLLLENLDKLPPNRSTLIAAWQLATTRPKLFRKSIIDGTISPFALRSTIRQLKHCGELPRKALHIASDTKCGKVKGTLLQGDCLTLLKSLKADSINCCITSPPCYQTGDCEVAGQIGMESTPEEYVEKLVAVFREVRRVLKSDGTLWINIGDTYAQAPDREGSTTVKRKGQNCKPKDLIGLPWMLAFALRKDGWYLRSEIVWHKSSVTPESVKDRPTRNHEQIFLLTKSPQYFYEADAIREPSEANRRTVWTIAPGHFQGAHVVIFPTELPEMCMRAGCPIGGTVLDCFAGAGTTLMVASQNERNYVGIELNQDCCDLTRKRLSNTAPPTATQPQEAHQHVIREELAKIEPCSFLADIKTAVVKDIGVDEARAIIQRNEWLRTMPAFVIKCFGIFFDGELGGVAVYSQEPGENLGIWDRFGFTNKIICLSRGACAPWAHKHSATKLIRASMKMLPEKYKVVTCTADATAGEVGVIYAACGFDYIGTLSEGGGCKASIINPDGKRTSDREAYHLYGTRSIKKLREMGFTVAAVPRKGRYFGFLGSRKEKRGNRNQIFDLIKPYPKRAAKSAETGTISPEA